MIRVTNAIKIQNTRFKKIKPIVFTKEGFDKTQQERQKLLEERVEAVKTLQQARELGDLSENGLYKAARLRLSSIDGRIRRINEILKYGKIVVPKESSIVDVGTKVTVTDGERNYNYHIVGSLESDPILGKISHNSPVGKSLIGKKVGEKVTVQAPKKSKEFKILKIQ